MVTDPDRDVRNRSTSRVPEAPLYHTRMGYPLSENGFSKHFQRSHRFG